MVSESLGGREGGRAYFEQRIFIQRFRAPELTPPLTLDFDFAVTLGGVRVEGRGSLGDHERFVLLLCVELVEVVFGAWIVDVLVERTPPGHLIRVIVGLLIVALAVQRDTDPVHHVVTGVIRSVRIIVLVEDAIASRV